MASTVLSKEMAEYLAKCRLAICDSNIAVLESLREGMVQSVIEPLITDYQQAANWNTRDSIVFLFQDLDDSRLTSIMKHALDSPTVESRAVAVCFLVGDHTMFTSFLANGFVDPRRVDAAISQLRSKGR